MRLRDFRGTPGFLLFGLLSGCVGGRQSVPAPRPEQTQALQSFSEDRSRFDAAEESARLAAAREAQSKDPSPYAPTGPAVTQVPAFVRPAPATLAVPDADSLADEGAARLRRGDLAGAERSLRAALALDPNHRRAAVLLGQTLTQQARVEDPARPLGWEQSAAAARTGPALPPPGDLADPGTAPPNKLPAGFDQSPPRSAPPRASAGGITPVGYTQEATEEGPPLPPPPVLAAKPDADPRPLSPAGPAAPRGPMARLQPPQDESELPAPPAAAAPAPPVVTVSAPVVEPEESAVAAPKRSAVLLAPMAEPEPSPEVGPPAPPKPTAVIPAPPSAIIATSAAGSSGPVFVTPPAAPPALLPPEVVQPAPVVQAGPVPPKPILLERVDSDNLRPVPLDKPADVAPTPTPAPAPKPPVQVNITDVKAE